MALSYCDANNGAIKSLKKRCPKCKRQKRLELFGKSSLSKDGRKSWCKSCRKKYESRKRYAKWLYYARGRPPILREDFNKMLEKQNGMCAICKTEVNQDKRNQRLCIDHDAKTGEIRGILCHLCNRGLGHFKDNPDFLLRAAEYLS